MYSHGKIRIKNPARKKKNEEAHPWKIRRVDLAPFGCPVLMGTPNKNQVYIRFIGIFGEKVRMNYGWCTRIELVFCWLWKVHPWISFQIQHCY